MPRKQRDTGIYYRLTEFGRRDDGGWDYVLSTPAGPVRGIAYGPREQVRLRLSRQVAQAQNRSTGAAKPAAFTINDKVSADARVPLS